MHTLPREIDLEVVKLFTRCTLSKPNHTWISSSKLEVHFPPQYTFCAHFMNLDYCKFLIQQSTFYPTDKVDRQNDYHRKYWFPSMHLLVGSHNTYLGYILEHVRSRSLWSLLTKTRLISPGQKKLWPIIDVCCAPKPTQRIDGLFLNPLGPMVHPPRNTIYSGKRRWINRPMEERGADKASWNGWTWFRFWPSLWAKFGLRRR